MHMKTVQLLSNNLIYLFFKKSYEVESIIKIYCSLNGKLQNHLIAKHRRGQILIGRFLYKSQLRTCNTKNFIINIKLNINVTDLSSFHEHHVDEGNENGRSTMDIVTKIDIWSSSSIMKPFEKNQKYQVAEEKYQKDDLRNELENNADCFLEKPAKFKIRIIYRSILIQSEISFICTNLWLKSDNITPNNI